MVRRQGHALRRHPLAERPGLVVPGLFEEERLLLRRPPFEARPELLRLLPAVEGLPLDGQQV